MKVVVLYEAKKNRDDITSAIEAKGHDVELVVNSNDFFEAVYAGNADKYIIDVRSWYRGSAIYNYFDIPQKISSTPIVFINIPDGFSAIDGRDALSNDVTLEKDASFENIADAL